MHTIAVSSDYLVLVAISLSFCCLHPTNDSCSLLVLYILKSHPNFPYYVDVVKWHHMSLWSIYWGFDSPHPQS